MSNIFLVFTDGGARGNPGPGAIGVVIKTEKGEVLEKISKPIGNCTNNEAEYKALIEALHFFSQKQKEYLLTSNSKIHFYIDSTLIVNQVNGIFKVKDGRMRDFIYKVRELETSIPGKIYYSQIPREKNIEADFLVNQALDSI